MFELKYNWLTKYEIWYYTKANPHVQERQVYVEMLPVIWTLLNGFSFKKKSRHGKKKFWEKNCLQLKCKQQLSWAYFKMFDQTYY